jgi:anthranilate synthase component I
MLTQTMFPTTLVTAPAPLPLIRELPADLETPVSVYLKLAGHGPSFLLESVTGGQQVARYSFIGVDPQQAYVLQDGQLRCTEGDGTRSAREIPIAAGQDPLDALRSELASQAPIGALQPAQPGPAGLPPFTGGLVGYLAYETIRYFEPAAVASASATAGAQRAAAPEAIFLLADTVVAFDHAYGRMLLIANIHPAPGQTAAEAEAAATERLAELQRRLAAPMPAPARVITDKAATELSSNLTQAQYMAAVEQAKEYIAAGDIFQVVLSQRFSRQTSAGAFDIYRALRRLNPSPYMFFFDFGSLAGEAGPLHLIGASPEVHVRLHGRTAELRPIAGTRPRGADDAADEALAEDLLADPKERAEHVMLVDLARNDLGRVCTYGSVHVPELMAVERYSHVMHIVSQVEGILRAEYDAFDLLRATFPAGTVSGAPKIRAMQIINELEGCPRGPYAGAVGYFSYDGNLDTCITIRTLVMQGDTVSVQAGAGIVADSDPEREYQETVNKARALAVAVARAEERHA